MDEPTIDLRDHRGRLRRVIAAAALGILITVIVLGWIRSVAATPNADPVSGASVGLLAIAMGVVISMVMHGLITAIARRRRRA